MNIIKSDYRDVSKLLKYRIGLIIESEMKTFFKKKGGSYFKFKKGTQNKYKKMFSNIDIEFTNSYSGVISIGTERAARKRNVDYRLASIHDRGIKKDYYIRPKKKKWLVFPTDEKNLGRSSGRRTRTFVKKEGGTFYVFTKEVLKKKKEGIRIGSLISGKVEQILSEVLQTQIFIQVRGMLTK